MLRDCVLRGAGAVLAPLLMMAASLAAAQTPPGPGAPGGGRPDADPIQMLVNSPQLQAELTLDESQVRKLQRIEPEFRNERLKLLQQMAPGNSPEKIQAARMSLMEIDRGGIARVLTRTQLERFHQIMLQIDGACLAIRDEGVFRSLGLQPAQAHDITVSCQRLHATMKAPPPANSREEHCAAITEMQVKYEKAKEQTEAEIAAMLSGGQRAILRSMAGRPFKMDPPRPPECR